MQRTKDVPRVVFFLTVGLAAAAAFPPALELDEGGSLPDGGKIWVLLVAGSRGYFNYRHQADVCHAYQIVHAHGIPDENVVVMMYDDIANSKENPTPGVIVNRPNGTNVYKGVPKDYVGDDNNPETFLKVLQGMDMDGVGSGKTIASGSNDHVFVYFADHGAPGILGFPKTFLKAPMLSEAIDNMRKGNKYKKMVFYVEACESGSMFKDRLPDDIDVFATTASNSTAPSFACYFDKYRKTFLGDVYSVKWLEDSDKKDLNKETLESQYKVVKEETNTSTVCQFGTMDISKMTVSNFQGMKEPDEEDVESGPFDPKQCGRDAVAGPDAHMFSLEFMMDPESGLSEAEREEARRQYDELVQARKNVDYVIKSIADQVTGLENSMDDEVLSVVPETITEGDCYYAAVDRFHESCFDLIKTDWAMRRVYTLANLCEMQFGTEAITEAIQAHCDSIPTIQVHP